MADREKARGEWFIGIPWVDRFTVFIYDSNSGGLGPDYIQYNPFQPGFASHNGMSTWILQISLFANPVFLQVTLFKEDTEVEFAGRKTLKCAGIIKIAVWMGRWPFQGLSNSLSLAFDAKPSDKSDCYDHTWTSRGASTGWCGARAPLPFTPDAWRGHGGWLDPLGVLRERSFT